MAAIRHMQTVLTKTTPTPTALADILSISAMRITRGDIDVTTIDSSSDFREFIGSFQEVDEITVTGIKKGNIDLAAIWTLQGDASVQGWSVEFPDGDSITFDAYVKGVAEVDVTIETARGFEFVLKVSGPLTYVEATPSI
jgi:hypothetical protein